MLICANRMNQNLNKIDFKHSVVYILHELERGKDRKVNEAEFNVHSTKNTAQ